MQIAIFVCGCGQDQPSAPPQPDAPGDPMESVARSELTVPKLRIEILPHVRTWEETSDQWAVEATVKITNEESTPIVLDPGRLRLRDQSRPLQWSVQGEPERVSTLEPGASLTVRIIGGRDRSESEQPTLLQVDYGTIFGMTPAVSAPVTVVRTDGLVARFSDPQPPQKSATEYVRAHGSRPIWRVRLAVTVENPTGELVRMLYGGVTARCEYGDGSSSSDHAGLSVPDDWFAPGTSQRGQVELLFDDSPTAPRRIELSFRSAKSQAFDLPAPAPVARANPPASKRPR